MTIRENLRPHLSMLTPASRQPTKLPMDNMPAEIRKLRVGMRSIVSRVLTVKLPQSV